MSKTVSTLSEIVEHIQNQEWDLVNESSLWHVYKHVQDNNSSFAILTSWDDENDLQVNRIQFADLKNKIKKSKCGYKNLVGFWIDKNNVRIEEPSLFVIGINKDQALSLMDTYNQEAIIYKGIETDNQVCIFYSDGTKQVLGTFHPNKIAQAYSTLKGKSFLFEYAANSFMEAVALNSKRKKQ